MGSGLWLVKYDSANTKADAKKIEPNPQKINQVFKTLAAAFCPDLKALLLMSVQSCGNGQTYQALVRLLSPRTA